MPNFELIADYKPTGDQPEANKEYNEEHREYCRKWAKEHREYFRNYYRTHKEAK